jgi:hypothetical protein
VDLDQRANLVERFDCCRFRGRVCLLHLPTGKEPAIIRTRSEIVRLRDCETVRERARERPAGGTIIS